MRKIAVLFVYCFLSVKGFSWTHQGSNTYGWKRKQLTFYVNSASCSSIISESNLNQLIDKAIQAWNGVPGSDLELIRSSSAATDGDTEFRAKTATQVPLILCSTQLSDYGSVSANSTLAFVPYFDEDSEGYVQYSGLVLNAQPGAAANLAQFSSDEIELIVGHEIGHVLGLGHSGDPDSLMYFQLNKDFLLITRDDEDGIAHLYPRNLLDGALGCASIHRPSTQLPVTGLLATLVFLLALIGFGRLYSKTERPL